MDGVGARRGRACGLLFRWGSLLLACGDDRAPDPGASQSNELNETSAPRAGSTIRSPSVDPTKTYWGSRDIGKLTSIARLRDVEVECAADRIERHERALRVLR